MIVLKMFPLLSVVVFLSCNFTTIILKEMSVKGASLASPVQTANTAKVNVIHFTENLAAATTFICIQG